MRAAEESAAKEVLGGKKSNGWLPCLYPLFLYDICGQAFVLERLIERG